MIVRKTWKEFQDIGLLWWINRTLHLFGWALVYEMDDANGSIKEVYPARVKFRGFNVHTEERGYTALTQYLKTEVDALDKECKL